MGGGLGWGEAVRYAFWRDQRLECVRLFLLVLRSVGLFDEDKLPPFIEPARRQVTLKRPKLQAGKGRLGDAQELSTDSLALEFRENVKLIDPTASEGDNPTQAA